MHTDISSIKQDKVALDAIEASLYRCASLELPDMQVKLPEVSESMKRHSAENISGHTLLIRDSTPEYYENLTSALAENRSVLFYVSTDLDIYGSYGDAELKAELKQINFRFGASLAEEKIGTNAAALAVRSPFPVWTSGEQNFAGALHPYTFYAFTVHGAYSRAVVVLLCARTRDVDAALVCLFRLIKSMESITSSGALTEDVLIKDALLKYNYSDERTENLMVILNKHGRITYANNQFYAVSGLSYNDVINYPINEIVPEFEYIFEYVNVNETPSPRKISIGRAGGGEYYVSCSRQSTGETRHGIVVTAQRVLSQHHDISGIDNGTRFTFDNIIGVSDRFLQLKLFAGRVAETDCTVLIRGESGTGKELFAQSIHNASDRSSKPFVSINCGAIPRELIGSELFGYVPGAFTGASRSGAKGKFEQADGGTLFLDEIAEMPLDMQAVLLRVLEEKTVTRIGGSKEIPVNVRLIAATNQNLADYIKRGKFRLDLYYRLNIVSLNIMPLREHRKDIDHLSDFYLRQFCEKHHKKISGISVEARAAMECYDWPGNIRELRNAVEHGVIMSDGEFVELKNLPSEISSLRNEQFLKKTTRELSEEQRFTKTNMSQQEEQLRMLMRQYDGNKAKVARQLQIARGTLYKLLDKYGIN